MFERFRGGLGDVLSLYNAKTWDEPYVVAVRGLGVHNGGFDLFEGNDFPSLLSGELSSLTSAIDSRVTLKTVMLGDLRRISGSCWGIPLLSLLLAVRLRELGSIP
eukprot:SAG31_NODE_10370_length_1147_cov_0.752863_1_plen_105_part_00